MVWAGGRSSGLQKLADARRRLPRLALEQAVRRIDLDEGGCRRLLPDQTRRRFWDQAVMPGYEAHDRDADAGKSVSNVAVGNRFEATANGLRRHAGKNLLMQVANGRRDPAAQHQKTRQPQ